MLITDDFFRRNEKLWESYISHPFIVGMVNATLPIEKFKYYMLQDYLYLKEYAKVFAIGATKSDNSEELDYFSEQLKGIGWEIANVHLNYMKSLGISDEDIKLAKPSLDNVGYTSYMKSVAYEGDSLVALVAVLSCSWSYAFIAKRMLELNPQIKDDNTYKNWILAYISDEYTSANASLMEMVNKKSDNISIQKVEKLNEIFRVCSEFEMKFWDRGFLA